MTKISKKSENRPSLSTQGVLSWWRWISYGLKGYQYPPREKPPSLLTQFLPLYPLPKKNKIYLHPLPPFFPFPYLRVYSPSAFSRVWNAWLGEGVSLCLYAGVTHLCCSHQPKPLVILTQFFQLKN